MDNGTSFLCSLTKINKVNKPKRSCFTSSTKINEVYKNQVNNHFLLNDFNHLTHDIKVVKNDDLIKNIQSRRKIEIEIKEMNDGFFEQIPFYHRVEHMLKT